MKLKRAISLTLAVWFLVITMGCRTPEQGAYRTLGTLATVVDTTMLTYGDAFRAGLITPEEQLKVRDAYEHYQRSMRIARAAVTTVKVSPEGESRLNTALTAVEAASSDLITLIHLIK
jgi:hypothetical protein